MLNKRGDTNSLWIIVGLVLAVTILLLFTLGVSLTWKGFYTWIRPDNTESVKGICEMACTQRDQLAFCNTERSIKTSQYRLSTVGLLDKVAAAETTFKALSGQDTTVKALDNHEKLVTAYNDLISSEKELVNVYKSVILKDAVSADIGDVEEYFSSVIVFVTQTVANGITQNVAYKIGETSSANCIKLKTVPTGRESWFQGFKQCLTYENYYSDGLTFQDTITIITDSINQYSNQGESAKVLATAYVKYKVSEKAWDATGIKREDMKKLDDAYREYTELNAVKENYLGKKVFGFIKIQTGSLVEGYSCNGLLNHVLWGSFFEPCSNVAELCGESSGSSQQISDYGSSLEGQTQLLG